MSGRPLPDASIMDASSQRRTSLSLTTEQTESRTLPLLIPHQYANIITAENAITHRGGGGRGERAGQVVECPWRRV